MLLNLNYYESDFITVNPNLLLQNGVCEWGVWWWECGYVDEINSIENTQIYTQWYIG